MVVVALQGPSPDMLSPVKYWREALAGCEHTPYPPLPSFLSHPRASKIVQYRLRDLGNDSGCVATSTLVYAAWALVTGCMTDSEDVIFGVKVPEGHEPIPFRSRLQGDQSIEAYLRAIHQQATEKLPQALMGLNQIAEISADCREACLFQTVLDVTNHPVDSSRLQQDDQHGLAIQFQLKDNQMDASAFLDPRMIEPQLVYKLLYRLGYVMQQLARAKPEAILADIEFIPPSEWSMIQELNSLVPPVAEKRIHDVIQDHASGRPNAQAVCAWDGEMTYQKLEEISTNVARRLVEAGVGPEKVVPLCFEKSKWTVVAMLAVLKAGGAFILLDRSLPAARIQNICRKVNAETCITSVSCESLLSSFVPNPMVLCNETAVSSVSGNETFRLHTASTTPRNAAYIIFTSGSTGEPKGCVVEHQSYCSAAFAHGEVLGMNSGTRALQFGSYNFAGAIMETIMTLMYGGCVCIPSDEDRSTALAQAIGKLNANWAFLTSTVLALIRPDDVPSLRTICVGGEPIRHSQIQEWAPRVQLRQTYGSAETAAVVASAGLNASSTIGSIGKPTTARCWLTHPADINRLVPIGAPGEVVFEGPVIGREYIGNPEKSSQAFIGAPTWREAFGPQSASSRFYRTGDIAVYKSDGSLELQGRKDTQVKIRGQRVELGEIEHQTRLASPGLKEVAVDIAVVGGRPTLICFIVLASSEDSITQASEDYNGSSAKIIQTVRSQLEIVLPQYMVPSMFLPIATFPLTISGKLDRRRLREEGATMATRELLESRSAASKDLVQPSTETEILLQKIWSEVLKTEQSSIGINTSFFHLGGDSVSAMKVIAETRMSGMHLTIADVFRSDTIAGLAHEQSLRAQLTPPLSQSEFLDELSSTSVLDTLDLKDTDVQRKDIEAIYPLTGVQDLLVSTSKSTGVLADYFLLDLRSGLDLSKLEAGCRRACQSFPILRACWLRLQEKYWQVVLRDIDQPFRIIHASGDLAEFCQNFCLADMQSLLPTQPTAAWFLLKHESGDMKLALRMSHGQYDAFSMPLIFESVFDDYEGKGAPTQPAFPTFLSLASRRRSHSVAHWSEVLRGSQLTRIAPHTLPPAATLAAKATLVMTQAEAHLPSRPQKITPATLVRTAWAVLLSGLTGATDVVFGQVIAGRNAEIPQIDKIVGCCLNIVPERVDLTCLTTVAELLHANQEQLLKMGDADSLDCRDILEHCTNWPSEDNFDSILHHRDIDAEPEVQTPTGASRIKTLALPLLPPFLFVVSVSKGENISIELFGNSHLLTQDTTDTLARKLAQIVEKMGTNPDMPISYLLQEAGFTVQ
ncbi:hypothetical protein F4808DRAFT_414403 [Astrocystis sublimbata]|nr:hypothetical protein F4808DRAFT_414403 [Astrocystis sublimbata]